MPEGGLAAGIKGSLDPQWRRMQTADLPWVTALAGLVHVNYPEDDAIFAERLALAPQGCWSAIHNRELVGYVISHPWTSGDPPRLNARLGSLPGHLGCWYIHDLAVAPGSRAAGLGSAAAAILQEVAHEHRMSRMELTAVPGSESFWERHGFRVTPHLPDSLESYGKGARLMARDLP
jgi:ribosomal protein S18 acetylase RimI-like enzyme